MKFEVRLSGDTSDVFYERREPKNPKRPENYHTYWFAGEVQDDGALEVFEFVQLFEWSGQSSHYVLQTPSRRRKVAHYRHNTWLNFATIDEPGE